MLYIIATPIGNLADITLRALETLKSCDYILCEDTRHSAILLKHHHIHKPLKSYHKFNEAFRAESILEDLSSGKIICLISDAGTPGIADPGADIIKLCIEMNLPFTAIPGPCAAIQGLICSGLPTDRFQFCGFLPRKEGELKNELQKLLAYQGTSICYESPHRLIDTLRMIHTLEPHRKLVVGRELTKKFEEFARGVAQDLINHWQNNPLKGEVVLLISPSELTSSQDWDQWSPEEHVAWIQENYHMDRKEAIKLAAEIRGVPKRQIYQATLSKNIQS